MSRVRSNRVSMVLLAIASIGSLVGCGSTTALPPPPAGAATPAARAAVSAPAPVVLPGVFGEAELQESDTTRDPFRSYAKSLLPTETEVVPQYPVFAEKYAISEVKLVAIVPADGDGPRAMFVDPQGKGWIVQRGAHIGRGETVKLGPGVMSAYPLHWKVDRVRPASVVLVREDSLHPEASPTYREVVLHPEEKI